MTEIEIKRTTYDDLDGLRKVLVDTALFPDDMLPDLLSRSLSGADRALWLTCHHRGSAAGFSYTVPEDLTDGAWNMRALAVSPALQGSGLGSALVRATEAELRQMGGRLLIVDTSGTDDFAVTRRFYRRNGYAEEARIRDFWAEGADKVTYRKSLRS